MSSSSRRERPPSGQVNRPKTAGPVPSARMLFSARKDSQDVCGPEVKHLLAGINIIVLMYFITRLIYLKRKLKEKRILGQKQVALSYQRTKFYEE